MIHLQSSGVVSLRTINGKGEDERKERRHFMRGEREKRQWEGQTRIGKGTNRKKKEKKKDWTLLYR